jgi:hypothetical protein
MLYGDQPGSFPGFKHPAYQNAFQAGQRSAESQFEQVNPEYAYTGRRGRSIGIQAVTVPLLLVLVGGFSIAGFAYAAATNLAEIRASIGDLNTRFQDRFSRLDDKLGAYVQDINSRFAFMQSEMEAKTNDRWSKANHDLWCSRTEVKNPGWYCGRVNETTPAAVPPDLSAPPLGPSAPLGAWRTSGQK